MSMCRVFSCVVWRRSLLWPVYSLGKTLLTFALLCSVLQVQICLLLQVFLDFLHISFQIIVFVFFGKSPEVDLMGHMVVLVLIIRRIYLFVPLVCVCICLWPLGLSLCSSCALLYCQFYFFFCIFDVFSLAWLLWLGLENAGCFFSYTYWEDFAIFIFPFVSMVYHIDV